MASYDYYARHASLPAATLMHTVLYKAYVVEIFFLNIYILLGLLLSVGLLFLFKVWLNPATVGRLYTGMRRQFAFFFPTNVRMRVMNKFRRQGRRRNSSHVLFS